MTRHSSLSQDLECPCFSRGYVIDGQGDFAACSYCPAGATWAAEQAEHKAAQTPAAKLPLELKPARRSKEAKPFAEAIAADAKAHAGAGWHHRDSEAVPGLSLETRGATFRFTYQGQAYTVFLWRGRAILLDVGALFGVIPFKVQDHMETVLAAYASRMGVAA